METQDPRFTEDKTERPPAEEHNYSAHQRNPGPAPQAVHEDDRNGAGQAMKWIIPILIVILAIIYWIFFNDRPAVN